MGLTDPDEVENPLGWLVEFNWLHVVAVETGGRAIKRYSVHAKALTKAA